LSVQAIVCTSCGASLEPKLFETKVKCPYCGTVFAIVRDHEGVRGIAPEGAAAASPAGATASAPATATPAAGPSSGFDPQTIARIERDAVLVVRGLEAVEKVALATTRGGRGGCVIFLAISLAGLLLVL
jgi:predicted RNA-binding Zn-ribbon protein involved in translation (DUF1610 family)